MGRKNKYTAEAKIKAVEQYLNGNASLSILANELDVDESSIRAWKRQYQKCGAVEYVANSVPPKSVLLCHIESLLLCHPRRYL